MLCGKHRFELLRVSLPQHVAKGRNLLGEEAERLFVVQFGYQRPVIDVRLFHAHGLYPKSGCATILAVGTPLSRKIRDKGVKCAPLDIAGFGGVPDAIRAG